MPPIRARAVHGDAQLRSSRLDAHLGAGTVDPDSPIWTGIGGTPAGCIAASDDSATSARVTGFPTPFMPRLDFLCARSGGPHRGVGLARPWLLPVAPGGERAGVPIRIPSALPEKEMPGTEDEPEVATAQVRIAALHRAAAEGGRPDPTAWRPDRTAAVSVTDGAREPAGRRYGRLAETAAWDPLTASTILREAAGARLEVRAAAAAAGRTDADDATMETCFQDGRIAHVDAGGQPDGFVLPPVFRAHEPGLAERFEVQPAVAKAACLRAVETLTDLCLALRAAAEIPATPSEV